MKTNKPKTNKRYFIQGMHCSACEMLIKQDVENLEGIQKADVSLGKQELIIYTNDKKLFPSEDTLNSLFKELGYKFSSTKIMEQALVKEDLFKIGGIAFVFIICFYLFEKSGLLMSLSLTSQSSLPAYFLFGLAAGISSCAALVGGLLLSLSKKWNDLYGNNSKQSKKPFIFFNLSRVITFALIGGVLGYLGSFFKLSITITAFITILISILMFILGLQMAGVRWFNRFKFNLIGNNKFLDKNNDFQGKYFPIIVGALTFFIPCGFTLIAQTNALNSGSFYLGFLQLAAFALGTLPVLALISFTSIRFYSNPNFSKKFSLFSGIIISFFALYTFNSQLNVLGITSLNDINLNNKNTKPTETAGLPETNFQEIQMEAAGFEYYPKKITLKSGVKTKWSIYNSGATGCANAVYARGLYPNVIQLEPGMNVVEFTAPKPGTYKISCSMGMVDPVTVNVL